MRIWVTVVIVIMISGIAFSQVKVPTFSGQMFGDYYYVLQYHGPSEKNYQAFDYRRLDLAAMDTLSTDFLARFCVESDQSTSLSSGALGFAVKHAYLDWENAFWGTTARMGLQPTPAIDLSESVFGYRSLEKSIQDLHGISPFVDMGVALYRNFGKDLYATAEIGNNSGDLSSVDRYKRLYLQLTSAPKDGLIIGATVDYAGGPQRKYLRTGDLLVARKSAALSGGAETVVQAVEHGEPNGSTLKSFGISLNAAARIMRDFALVARYDYWQGDSKTRSTGQSLYLLAFDFAAMKNVHFMPNV